MVAHWWHGGRPARRLPPALMAVAIGRLRPGAETPWPRQGFALELDADGLPLAVVATASVSPIHGLVALGFAARPGRAAALEAAVLEMIQSEIANDLLFLRLRRAGPAPDPVDQERLAAKQALRPEALLATADGEATDNSTDARGLPARPPGRPGPAKHRGFPGRSDRESWDSRREAAIAGTTVLLVRRGDGRAAPDGLTVRASAE